jgi:hypothetical protein
MFIKSIFLKDFFFNFEHFKTFFEFFQIFCNSLTDGVCLEPQSWNLFTTNLVFEVGHNLYFISLQIRDVWFSTNNFSLSFLSFLFSSFSFYFLFLLPGQFHALFFSLFVTRGTPVMYWWSQVLIVTVQDL